MQCALFLSWMAFIIFPENFSDMFLFGPEHSFLLMKFTTYAFIWNLSYIRKFRIANNDVLSTHLGI